MAWVREVAGRYGFSDLEVPPGSVIMENQIKHCGGSCFYCPGRGRTRTETGRLTIFRGLTHLTKTRRIGPPPRDTPVIAPV